MSFRAGIHLLLVSCDEVSMHRQARHSACLQAGDGSDGLPVALLLARLPGFCKLDFHLPASKHLVVTKHSGCGGRRLLLSGVADEHVRLIVECCQCRLAEGLEDTEDVRQGVADCKPTGRHK